MLFGEGEIDPVGSSEDGRNEHTIGRHEPAQAGERSFRSARDAHEIGQSAQLLALTPEITSAHCVGRGDHRSGPAEPLRRLQVELIDRHSDGDQAQEVEAEGG